MNIVEEEFLWKFGDPPDGAKDLVYGAIKRAREEWDAADDEQKAAILRGRVFSARMFNEAVDSQSETLQRAALEVWDADLSSEDAQREWIANSINTMVEKEQRRMNLEHERNRAPVAQMLDQRWLSTLSAEPYRGLQHSIAHKSLFKPNDDGLPHREIPGKNGARTSITLKPDEL